MIEAQQVLSLAAMFMIGLLGSGHCVGMCGGIATGLGLATAGGRSGLLVIGYNLGRISSYALAGALVATLGYWGANYLALGPVLRGLAGVVLVLMGLYLADWWRILVVLEKAGARLWALIQPLGRRLMPVQSLPKALVLGLVWGWLPCGLVYSALAYAASSANPLTGALMMIAFGAGTAPAMIAGGLFSGAMKRFLQARPVRTAMALMMIAFGLWTLTGVFGHSQHNHHSPQSGAESGSMEHTPGMDHSQHSAPAGAEEMEHHHH